MSEIECYEFGGHQIQVFMIDGKPWWLANEVCKVLGYKDPVKAVKQHVIVPDRAFHPVRHTGQFRRMWIINESGLNSLILGSQLPAAKEFRHWVTSEVLPSIRKTGGYIDPGASTEQLEGLKDRVTQLAGDKRAAIMREAKERKKSLAEERKANRALKAQYEADQRENEQRIRAITAEAELAAEKRISETVQALLDKFVAPGVKGEAKPPEAEKDRILAVTGFEPDELVSIRAYVGARSLLNVCDMPATDNYAQVTLGAAYEMRHCPFKEARSPHYRRDVLDQVVREMYPQVSS